MATVTSGTANLYYEAHGEGPALVFAHGRGGNANSWWQQVPHFARTHRVVVFDHRTFGRSRGGGEAFTQRQLADDLMAILDAEGIARAALVCQSMGGWTGLGAALHHPERVACLVLTSTLGGITSPEIVAKLDELRGAGPPPPLATRALAPDFPAREPAMALLYTQLQAFNTAFDGANMERLRDAANGVPAERLAGYATPTLFVISEHDQIFPPEVLRLAAALVPGAETAEFSGAGHSPYWERPEAYNALIEAYLRKNLER